MEWSNNTAYNLGARTQSHRGEVARVESSLEQRTSLPRDAESHHRSVAVHCIQRVSANHRWTRRDAILRPSACPPRILERLEGITVYSSASNNCCSIKLPRS